MPDGPKGAQNKCTPLLVSNEGIKRTPNAYEVTYL